MPWIIGGHAIEQPRQIGGVVVTEDVFLGAAVADAGDHRGMVERIREYDGARHLARQRRQSGVVGDITRGKDQCGFTAVQIGDLALEEQMDMAVARDVARPAGHSFRKRMGNSEGKSVPSHA